jgi:glycosyltransferase involved in cell wall biosynthesis
VSLDPLVSIGLPVYNGEESIQRSIHSLLNQSYKNIELIISDNGSTDNTLKIIKKFETFDSRVKVLHTNLNQGSIWNFNRVFLHSSGKYFMWASHDDHHEKTFISACVESMESDGFAALCAPGMQMTEAGSNRVIWTSSMDSFRGKSDLTSRYRETLWNFPAVSIYGLYRRELLAKTDLFPRVIGGDMVFIQNLAIYGYFIGAPGILFTRHGREKWNSVHQDYMTFFGRSKKPFWYIPFFAVFSSQIAQLLNLNLSALQRMKLLAILFDYQIRQFFLKLCIKFCKYVLPNRARLPIAKHIYWKFMNGPNIKTEVEDSFTERIIKPRIGWFN